MQLLDLYFQKFRPQNLELYAKVQIQFLKSKRQAVKVQELLTLSLLLPRKRAKTTGFCGEHLIPTQDLQKTNKSSEPGRAPAFPTSPTGPTLL